MNAIGIWTRALRWPAEFERALERRPGEDLELRVAELEARLAELRREG